MGQCLLEDWRLALTRVERYSLKQAIRFESMQRGAALGAPG